MEEIRLCGKRVRARELGPGQDPAAVLDAKRPRRTPNQEALGRIPWLHSNELGRAEVSEAHEQSFSSSISDGDLAIENEEGQKTHQERGKEVQTRPVKRLPVVRLCKISQGGLERLTGRTSAQKRCCDICGGSEARGSKSDLDEQLEGQCEEEEVRRFCSCNDRDEQDGKSSEQDDRRTHTPKEPPQSMQEGSREDQFSDRQSKPAYTTLYHCDICEKSYSSSTALTEHKRVHTGEKPYQCNFCDKAYVKKKYFDAHMFTHTGERPVQYETRYHCDVCGKLYTTGAALREHMRVHTGEKPYQCNFCGKTYTKKKYLDIHEFTHTGEKPFKCKFCGKGFSQSHSVYEHERTHTGEKPFKCDICGRTFSVRASLGDHRRTHTGDRPFKCEVCGKGVLAENQSQDTHANSHWRETVQV